MNKHSYNKLWKVVYKSYPHLLRVLERFKVHSGRQEFHIGFIKTDLEKLRKHLISKGFEEAILAWTDTDEVLSMRNVDKKIYQHHVRVYKDGEVKGHYEYSPEGRPFKHVLESCFKAEKKYFKKLLEKYLKA